ncbi:MAG: serine hydrolase domain-containing protein [Thermoanaerobaculia bacterium]
MFTAMAALKLRDQGKLRLEDPLCKYLDDCPEAWKPVTLQQLMRHKFSRDSQKGEFEVAKSRNSERGRFCEDGAAIPPRKSVKLRCYGLKSRLSGRAGSAAAVSGSAGVE